MAPLYYNQHSLYQHSHHNLLLYDSRESSVVTEYRSPPLQSILNNPPITERGNCTKRVPIHYVVSLLCYLHSSTSHVCLFACIANVTSVAIHGRYSCLSSIGSHQLDVANRAPNANKQTKPNSLVRTSSNR